MKTGIFYFSGTGNSLWAARLLAKELPDAQVSNISYTVQFDPRYSYERIGVVFPVYMFGLPLIVRSFLEKLLTSSETYIFAVATYGGLAGNALPQAARILAKRGLKLSAAFLLKMPGNYTPLYEALTLPEQDSLLGIAQARIGEIGRLIKEGRIVRPLGIPLSGWLFEGVYRLGSSRIPQEDKNFWVDERCDGCGICQKVCPVYNIRLFGGKPTWQHSCQQCLACLHWCPQEAIQYKKSTVGRKRYHNPYVQLKDFIVL